MGNASQGLLCGLHSRTTPASSTNTADATFNDKCGAGVRLNCAACRAGCSASAGWRVQRSRNLTHRVIDPSRNGARWWCRRTEGQPRCHCDHEQAVLGKGEGQGLALPCLALPLLVLSSHHGLRWKHCFVAFFKTPCSPRTGLLPRSLGFWPWLLCGTMQLRRRCCPVHPEPLCSFSGASGNKLYNRTRSSPQHSSSTTT